MRASIFFLCCILSIYAYGQQWQLSKSIHTRSGISSASKDSEGRIYIGKVDGTLQRFLPDGNLDEHFSDITNSTITSVEAWNKFKILLFFRDLQKISILDRFTTTPVDFSLSSYGVDFAWLISPGIDNSIWMLDANYNELRKYTMQTKQLILSTPLSLDMNKVTHMRSYQNLLIISDREQGLLFFDRFGNLLKTFEVENIDYFYIEDGKICFLQAGFINLLDPFDLADIKKIKAPEGAFEKVIISRSKYFLLSKNEILIYERAQEPR